MKLWSQPNLIRWLAPSLSVGLLALIPSAATAATEAVSTLGAQSAWVYSNANGHLAYKTTPTGDRIMDFSHAGYMGGGVALPTVPVKRTVQPSGGADDAVLIQSAINEVSKLALENGFRGAVLLGPGTFTCSATINIFASGVVLRGSGSKDEAMTTIKLVGKPHLGISVRSSAGGRGRANDRTQSTGSAVAEENFVSAKTKVADAYVPSGTSTFKVIDATGFAVGDTILIQRPVTPAWVKFMQMDNLMRDGRPQIWLRTGGHTTTERKLTSISGNAITVDVPLSDSLDSKYLNPPGTDVIKTRPPARVSQAGIEYLHIECPPQAFNHTQAHFSAIRLNGEDCWVRDARMDETMNSVGVGGQRITLERVVVNRKAPHQGSSKPAEFAPDGGQVLLDRCSGSGDNIWYSATGSGHAGPIVLLDCTFQGNGRIESHQRWSTGVLYDNCRVPGGGIDFRNRGSMGSGHGWTMGWGVAWNCEAKDFVIQNPPGAVNWMIGCRGISKPMPRPFDSSPNLPEGTADSQGKPVTPQSLYLAQLVERLGPQALTNIGRSSLHLK